MRANFICFLVLAALIVKGPLAFAQDVSYEEIVRSNLKNMTKLSGTFDLFDEKTQKVRNLRMIEILSDVRKEGSAAFVPVRFRDISTGDIVLVEVKVKMISEGRYDSQWAIKEVQTLKNETAAKETYTDEEIYQAINDYIKKQTKFTKNMMLFDPKTESMRSLELKSLSKEIRRFGILSIVAAEFKDVNSNDDLTVDFNVKKTKRGLEVDTMKIKKIKTP